MSKYSPTPWSVYKEGGYSLVLAKGGEEVAMSDGSYYEEDAHLIAAAPELLSALESIVLHANPDLFSEGQLKMARAAIRKAKGGSI